MTRVTCDDVFDVLTRGPFPTGEAGDAAVELHLAACHECRRLAETLQPAVSLFHEELSPDECRDLPGYSGRLAGGAAHEVSVALVAAAGAGMLAAPRKLLRERARTWGRVWLCRLAVSAALGACLVVAAGLVDRWLLPASNTTKSARTPLAAETFAVSRGQLADLRLSPACETERAGRHFVCCTECHVAGASRSLGKVELASLTRACGACHNSLAEL